MRLKHNNRKNNSKSSYFTQTPKYCTLHTFIVFSRLSHEIDCFTEKLRKVDGFFFLYFFYCYCSAGTINRCKKMNWGFIPRIVVIYLNEPIISALHLSWALEAWSAWENLVTGWRSIAYLININNFNWFYVCRFAKRTNQSILRYKWIAHTLFPIRQKKT